MIIATGRGPFHLAGGNRIGSAGNAVAVLVDQDLEVWWAGGVGASTFRIAAIECARVTT